MKVLSIAQSLILLIAFPPMIICPLDSSLVLTDHFLPSLMFLSFIWFKGVFLEVLKLIGDKADHGHSFYLKNTWKVLEFPGL